MDVVSFPVSDHTADIDAAGELFLRFIATRDTALLDQVLAEHLDRSYTQARRFLGRQSEAEDAVQEAFLLVVRKANLYDGTVPFAAWLGRIVHNCALMAIRKRGRRRKHEEVARAQREDDMLSAQNEEGIEAQAIRAAVSALPERYRLTVDLHYFGGLSQRDTAKALGVNENAVAMRLHRAREFLRTILQRRGVTTTIAGIALALTSAPTYAAPEHVAVHITLSLTATSSSGSFAAASGFGAAKAVKVALIILALGTGSVSAIHFARSKPVETAHLERHWTFERGLPDGFVIKQGEATLSAPNSTSPGRIVPGDSRLFILLPGQVPPAPLVVTGTFLLKDENVAGYYGAVRVDGDIIPGYKVLWKAPMPPARIGTYVISDYFIGDRDYKFMDGQLVQVREFEREYFGDRVCVNMRNADLEDLQLRVLDSLPDAVRLAQEQVPAGTAAISAIPTESF